MTAYIFDMDGVLIDSEPHWQRIEKQVFAELGIMLTDEMVESTTGLRNTDVVKQWYERFKWQDKSVEQVCGEIIEGMVSCFTNNPVFKPGARELICRLAENPDNRLAICSSSPMVLIETLVEQMGIEDKIKVLHSAEQDEFGKPHPMPYLKCAAKLGVDPKDCVVFEDSLNGTLSGKAADMYVVAVPDGPYSPAKFGFCQRVIDSLEDY